jgi:putative oxidoreductase
MQQNAAASPLVWVFRGLGIANNVGSWLPGLVLRLLLAWEFGEAGLEKLRGENWFNDIADQFPFPFSVIPTEISWQMATWFEVGGALLLVAGLATRFISVSLVILTIVAWAAVHAGNGYNVCDNGWKLPLIYLVMFVPLVFQGAGRLSVDRWFANRFGDTFAGRR